MSKTATLDKPKPSKKRSTEAANETLETDTVDPSSESADATQGQPEAPAEAWPDKVVETTEASEELLSLREWQALVKSKNNEVFEYATEHACDAAKAKASKKRLEAAQEALNDLIAKEPQKLPLFDKPKPDAKPSTTPDDESWRTVLLSDLDIYGLTPKIRESLATADIITLGGLSEYSKFGKDLTQIDGIGPKSVDIIDAATQAFWQERNRPLQPEAEREATDVEALADAEDTTE